MKLRIVRYENTMRIVWAKVQPYLQLQFTIFNFPLTMIVCILTGVLDLVYEWGCVKFYVYAHLQPSSMRVTLRVVRYDNTWEESCVG
jgi:hypothetical protein